MSAGHYSVEQSTAMPLKSTPASRMTPALLAVIAERERQVLRQGWTPEHDDDHADLALALAAACYAAAPELAMFPKQEDESGGRGETPVWRTYQVPELWPSSWHAKWWKPKDRRTDLVRAAALILAEIERLDRASGSAGVDLPAEHQGGKR